MPKSKWYAVAKGRSPGLYQTWDECKAQVAGFSGAIFKSFKTRDDAQAFMISNNGGASASPTAAATTSCSNVGKKRTRDVNDTTHISQNKRSNQQHHLFKRNDARFFLAIHFDGGSRGNPGVAGCGAEVIAVNNTINPPITTKYLIREFCGDRETNNYAEYHGLIAGLKQSSTIISELVEANNNTSSSAGTSSVSKPLFKLQVHGDSNLIIQQLKGNWRCKHENIKPLYDQCQRLIAEMKNIDTTRNSEVSFEHVYREQNKVADQLANEAMDQRRSWITSDADHVRTIRVGVVQLKTSRHSAGVAATRTTSREVIDLLDSGSDGSSHYC